MKAILIFENEIEKIIEFKNGIELDYFYRLIQKFIIGKYKIGNILDGYIQITENSFYENECCKFYNEALRIKIKGI